MKEFIVRGHKFLQGIDPRTGTAYITSSHPYDDAEYHWARQDKTGEPLWNVYINGFLKRKAKGTAEDVSHLLLMLDAGIHPRMQHL